MLSHSWGGSLSPDSKVALTLARKVQDAEHAVSPWVWAFVCNMAQFWLAGNILSATSTDTHRAALCYWFMWVTHASVPLRTQAHRQMRLLWTLLMNGMILVVVFVLAEHSAWLLVAAKLVAICLRYGVYVAATHGSTRTETFPWVVWLQCVVTSITIYGLALSTYTVSRMYPLEHSRLDATRPETDSVYRARFMVFAIAVPTVRGICKWILWWVLVENQRHSPTRSARALYITVGLDVPSYIIVYSQETTSMVAGIAMCHTAVDVLASLAVQKHDLLLGHHALPLQILALSMVVVVWPPLLADQPHEPAFRTIHSLMLVSRIFVAMCYSFFLWILCPVVHTLVWGKAMRPLKCQLSASTREATRIGSVTGLIDSLCFGLWAVALTTAHGAPVV